MRVLRGAIVTLPYARVSIHPAPVGYYYVTLVYGDESAQERGTPHRAPARTERHGFWRVRDCLALEEQHRHDVQRAVYWQRPPKDGEEAINRSECAAGNMRMRSRARTIWRLRRTPDVYSSDVCRVQVLGGQAGGSAEAVLR